MSNVNAVTKSMNTGTGNARSSWSSAVMFTVAGAGSWPGPIATMKPSGPTTTAPAASTTTGPLTGARTFATTTSSAELLMTVMVVSPGATAVTRPSADTVTTSVL